MTFSPEAPMILVLFGATGMIGSGALLECLDHPDVREVRVVTRRPTGQSHPKLREILHKDFADLSAIEADLTGVDGCLYCLGISSAGLSEAEYTPITYDYPLAAARALLRLSPGCRFIYVSGQGTDSTEQGRTMWARVKGRAENALLGLGLAGAYMFRPGYIQPVRGVRSATALYRALYAVFGVLYPVLRALAPNGVTDSARLGRAMIAAIAERGPSRVVDVAEINRLAGGG